MKKILVVIIGLLFLNMFSFELWNAARAPTWPGFVPPTEAEAKSVNVMTGPLRKNVMIIVNSFLTLLWLLGVLMIIQAWVKYILGGKVEEHKKIIMNVIIGFVIIILSYSIVMFLAWVWYKQPATWTITWPPTGGVYPWNNSTIVYPQTSNGYLGPNATIWSYPGDTSVTWSVITPSQEDLDSLISDSTLNPDWTRTLPDWTKIYPNGDMLFTNWTIKKANWDIQYSNWAIKKADWTVVYPNWVRQNANWDIIFPDWTILTAAQIRQILGNWAVVTSSWDIILPNWQKISAGSVDSIDGNWTITLKDKTKYFPNWDLIKPFEISRVNPDWTVVLKDGTYYFPDWQVLNSSDIANTSPDWVITLKDWSMRYPNWVLVKVDRSVKLANWKVIPWNQVDQINSDWTISMKNGNMVSQTGSFIKPNYYIQMSAKPSLGNAPLNVSFDALNSSDPRKRSIGYSQYVWSYTDESWKDVIIGQWPLKSYNFAKPWNYQIRLRIIADDEKSIASTEAYTKITVLPAKTEIVMNVNNKKVDSVIRLNVKDTSTTWVIFTPNWTKPQEWRVLQEYHWDFGNWSSEYYPNEDPIVQIYPKAWTYDISLEVKDNIGELTQKTYKLVIEPITAEITIEPEDWFVSTTYSISWLESKSSDQNITAYSWVIKAPDWKEVYRSDESNFNFIFKAPGSYTIILSVQNSKGQSVSASRKLIVKSKPPKALYIFESKSLAQPSVFIFDSGWSYDPENEKLKYSWDFNWDGIYEILNSDTIKTEFIYKDKWIYNVVLAVEDVFGNQDMFSRNIEVASTLNVDFDIDRMAIQKWSSIKFTPKVEGANSLMWNFWDWVNETNTWEPINHVFTKSWLFNVKMTAINADNEENSISKKVYVGDAQSPIGMFDVKVNGENWIYRPDLCWSWSDGIVVARTDQIEFNAEKSINLDSSNKWLSYNWDFGDGSTSQSSVARYRYSIVDDRCYPAKIKVKDNQTNKLSKVSNTVWFKVVNKKPVIWQLIVNPSVAKNQEGYYQTPINVKLVLPVAEDKDWMIKKYVWFYHEPSDDKKIGVIETLTPEAMMTIKTKGYKWQINEYVFAVEVEDDYWARVSNEEIYGESPVIRVINAQNQQFSVDIAVMKNQAMVWEKVVFYASQLWLLSKPVFKWDFNWDGIIDNETSNSEADYVFEKVGTYNTELRVVSPEDVTERAFKTIYVNPKKDKDAFGIKEIWPSWSQNADNGEDRNYISKAKTIELIGWQWIWVTSMYMQVLKYSETEIDLTAVIVQADWKLYEWETEFTILEGSWTIIPSTLKAVQGRAKAKVTKNDISNLKVKVSAKETVYWELTEILNLE